MPNTSSLAASVGRQECTNLGSSHCSTKESLAPKCYLTIQVHSRFIHMVRSHKHSPSYQTAECKCMSQLRTNIGHTSPHSICSNNNWTSVSSHSSAKVIPQHHAKAWGTAHCCFIKAENLCKQGSLSLGVSFVRESEPCAAAGKQN